MIFVIWCIVEEARIQRAVSRFINFIKPFLLEHIIFRVSHICINRLAIYINNSSYIVNGLHPSFNFEAVHSNIDQIRNVLQHAQIFRTHRKCVILLFEQRQLSNSIWLLMSRLSVLHFFFRCPHFLWMAILKQIVLPATGLAAAATVRVAISKMVRQNTSPRE
ncbi:hypothetical protein D3C78_698570 [compost metagenome]